MYGSIFKFLFVSPPSFLQNEFDCLLYKTFLTFDNDVLTAASLN